jgi:NAD(P)-dependent dehydrogenase (short-subunit alcohol dehydrogenase family)
MKNHNLYDFKGRTAIITGGGQGIGWTSAERIIEGGGSVAIWDRNQETLDKVRDQHPDESRVMTQNVDIGDHAAVEAATANVAEAFGHIDILVNNAAIVGPNASVVDYPPDAFEQVIHIGLIGTFYVSRAVVPHMIKQGYGRVVNVASVAGKEGNPNASAYSSMKAGVIALTKSLGKELAAHDIAVNAVTPAVARTELALQQSEEHIAYMLSKIPRGRMLELDEAAAMICWLATEENSFTTGGVFDLSGGRATY